MSLDVLLLVALVPVHIIICVILVVLVQLVFNGLLSVLYTEVPQWVDRFSSLVVCNRTVESWNIWQWLVRTDTEHLIFGFCDSSLDLESLDMVVNFKTIGIL